MRTFIGLALVAVLSGCAHDPRATVAVVGPNEMRDEYDSAARTCGVAGSLEYQLHCGVKEMFANNPRAPLDEARYVVDIELLHPLQARFGGRLDAKLVVKDRSTGQVIREVTAHAELDRSRPEPAVAQLLHKMASEVSSSR
jgi:hypothetical protein